jgi:precorrin-6B methylase 2
MTDRKELPTDAEKSPLTRFTEIMMGRGASQALGVAARLGLVDCLLDGPKSSASLAERLKLEPSALHRLLRMLVSVDVLQQVDGSVDLFAIGPLGQHLRSDASDSMRAMAVLCAEPFHSRTWEQLEFSVTTGKSGFEHAHGMPIYRYIEQTPGVAKVFYEAMAGLSQVVANSLLDAYDFSDIRTLVDVGGGYGALSTTILRAHPQVQGILFDLPHVIEKAKHAVHAQGLGNRIELVAGDMFESVPAGGDAYILKNIVHNWSDERASSILRRCKDCLGEGGRVFIVEGIVASDSTSVLPNILDLDMMMGTGGLLRTTEEYRALLKSAGLELTRVVDTWFFMSLLEARPKN